MTDSLWGEEFTIPEKVKTKKIISKINKEPKEVSESEAVEKQIKSKKVSVEEKLRLITNNVYTVLGKQVDKVEVITTQEELHNYITKGINFGRIAIDTETNNSLDPITCKLMGLCLYVKDQKQVYVPVNHINRLTGERLPDQLPECTLQEELEYLISCKSNVKCIFHNGKFDYQVLKCTCGVELPINWDTMLGAKLLDENEKSAGLKQQYIDKIDPEQEKYSIDHLFEKLPYEIVDPKIFALYAATDAMMTDKLYEWQMEQFRKPELSKVYELATEIEMPVVTVVAEMELTGVEFDKEYAQVLSNKYHAKLDKVDAKINIELDKLKSKIDAWRLTPDATAKVKSAKSDTLGKSKSEQLEDPINLGSPVQLAILLYDVLGVKQISKKSPRGTGEDILEKIDLPICKLLLERRAVVKLLDAFIDSLPEVVNPKDGRIHCHFNQYGAATGRFSSSDPNLQQIPSHNLEIRMMFKARDGYVMIGSDFSQQEPRLLSQFAYDENMINAYKQGKDLYATIAMGVYKTTYWNCMEHYEDGTPNPEGKKRRGSVKSLLLGIMYGRGVASIAEQIHGTVEEAQKIIDDFYKAFPKVKSWIENTQKNAHKTGYVEDLWGRRRRLPDVLLPKYEIKHITSKENENFNPFLECSDRKESDKLIVKYQKLLENIRGRKDYEKIQAQALGEGIEIHDNTGFIAQAERQCVNARIQGSAATMTKIAMRNIHHDKELNDLGFKLMIGVHDELIGECPQENAEKVADRLCYVMKTAAKDKCDVPFKCDPEITTCWYLTNYQDMVREEFEEYVEKGMTKEEAFDYICEDRPESTRDQMHETLDCLLYA